MLRITVTVAALLAACNRPSPAGSRDGGSGAAVAPRLPAAPALEELARRAVTPSLLRVDLGDGGTGTAFACLVPGLACTAKHVVGDATKVRVAAAGRTADAPVLAVHPEDDVALLDVRGLGLSPLAVTLLDAPPEGVTVCRLGYPPSHRDRPFVRCDPLGGFLLESSAREDGTVVPRIVHLGIGLKGDSGAPLYDPRTGLVVGMHVSEANGSGRAATPAAIHDTLRGIQAKTPWLSGCARGGPSEVAQRSLLLGCSDLASRERTHHFRRLGASMLLLGRHGEALAAFEEALEIDDRDARTWLWRALVFPGSAHARDDAAFAFRLDPGLREDAALAREVNGPLLAAARALRDELAPPGARLATLVGEGACSACESFCAAARKDPGVRLWAVEGANHPVAEGLLKERTGAKDGRLPLVAVDNQAAVGCGKLLP